MSKSVHGIIHVHSDFSRDGLCAIAELAVFARANGLSFVCLTDHAEDLSGEEMKRLRRLCDQHSDESLLMVPGLEYRCTGDIHILGLGIIEAIASVDPIAVASHIRCLGGIAILAHPGRNGYHVPRRLCGVLNGVEIWNAGSDGRFAPPMKALQILQESRDHNPAIAAFGGVDLHALDRLPGVKLEIRLKGSFVLDTQTLFELLLSGRFVIRGRYASFAGRLAPSRFSYSWLWGLRRIYEFSKSVRRVISFGRA